MLFNIEVTVNVLNLACSIFGRRYFFEQVGVDLNQRIPECDYYYTYMQDI